MIELEINIIFNNMCEEQVECCIFPLYNRFKLSGSLEVRWKVNCMEVKFVIRDIIF